MRKIKGYPGWAAALLLALLAAACLLCPPSAQADADWTRVDDASLGDVTLQGVLATSPSDVYAGGFDSRGGTIFHYDGAALTVMIEGLNTIRGFWAAGPDDVYAVGDVGAIVHYNGTGWTAMSSGLTEVSLKGVWGSGTTNVYAVGDSGAIVRYNGTGWSAVPSSGTTQTLNGVWGSGPNDVYAVGNSGAIVHYNGTDWSAITAATGTLLGVCGSGNDVYAVGMDNESVGVFLRHTVAAAVPVTGVTLSPETLTLAAGETYALTATVAPPEASNKSVTWSSGNEAVATVNAGGTVTAVSTGTAVITVITVDGGFTGSCDVTVSGAIPSAPEITPNGGTYEAPQSVTVRVYADLTTGRAIYYTTDGSAPTVTGGVYYTGPFALQLAQGATTVRAAVYDTGSGQWSGVSQAVFTVTGASGPVAPAVTDVSPTWGPVAGGTAVTVTGANLSTVQAVYFGGNAGTGLTVNSGASLTVTSPAGSGTVDVIVSGPGGASAANPAARFSYRTGAGELTGERVIATLPGSDAVLPFELYPGQRGYVGEPCFITVPAGTGQITVKKDPAKSITSLTVYDAGGNAFPADEGQPSMR